MKALSILFILFQFHSYALLCTKEYRPVCANGVTYSNACMAESSGVTEMTNGACSDHKEAKKEKTSPPRPEKPCICPMIWKPVCGVDGKTYGSSCDARCKSVPIKHQGECKKIETH